MRIVYDSLAELATTAAKCEELLANSDCGKCVLCDVCDPGIKMENRAVLRGAMINIKDGEYR